MFCTCSLVIVHLWQWPFLTLLPVLLRAQCAPVRPGHSQCGGYHGNLSSHLVPSAEAQPRLLHLHSIWVPPSVPSPGDRPVLPGGGWRDGLRSVGELSASSPPCAEWVVGTEAGFGSAFSNVMLQLQIVWCRGSIWYCLLTMAHKHLTTPATRTHKESSAAFFSGCGILISNYSLVWFYLQFISAHTGNFDHSCNQYSLFPW